MIVYRTTNLINGKQYIGKSVYDDPDYLGSGVLLKRAVEKYGPQNFKKTILEHCASEDQLNEREKFWIEIYDAVNDPNYYNVAPGGEGGNLYGNTEEAKKRRGLNTKYNNLNRPPLRVSYQLKYGPEWERKLEERKQNIRETKVEKDKVRKTRVDQNLCTFGFRVVRAGIEWSKNKIKIERGRSRSHSVRYSSTIRV